MQSFVINKEIMENRLDPFYYKPEYRGLISDLTKTTKNIKRLGELVNFSKERWDKVKWPTDVFRYIEINSIDIGTGEIYAVSVVEVKKAPSRAQMFLRKGDIIISTTRPYRGAIAIIPDKFDKSIGSTGFSILRNINDKVNKKYLFAILCSNIGLKQMEQRMSGGNYPAITEEELAKIFTPLPLYQIQDKIANIMDGAYKKQSEILDKVAKMLSAIEPCLLKGLGVKAPLYEQKNTFVVRFDDLKGKRFDVFHYQPMFQNLLELFKKAKIITKPLGVFIESINYGASVKAYPEGEIPFLRIQNLKENRLVLDELLCVKNDELTNSDYVQEGDFLISRSGTVGMVARVPKEANGFAFGSFMIRFRLKTSHVLNPDFAWLFLNHKLDRMQSTMSKTGGVQGNITIPAIKNIQIPILNITEQLNIVQEVMSQQKAVEGLKHEAYQIMDEAKQKVEKMILA